jgi:ABC-type phosphate/phosphonate transport system substrate-binding protein
MNFFKFKIFHFPRYLKLRPISLFFIFILIFINIAESFNSNQNKKNDIKIVNIGFLSNLFPETDFRDAKAGIESWGKELLKNRDLDYKLVALIYNDLPSISKAFSEKEISLIALHALDYLAIKNDIPIDPILVPARNGNPLDKYIILVNKKSKINNVNQLKNKRVSIQKGGRSLVQYIWFENLILKAQSIPIDRFCDIKEVSRESKAILSVFFEQNDACVVSQYAFESAITKNSQLKNDLLTIESSQSYLHDILCIARNVEKKYINDLFEVAILMNKNKSGEQIMNLFDFNSFLYFDKESIKSLELLYNENLKLRKKLKK